MVKETKILYKDFIEQQEQKDKIKEILGDGGISFLNTSLQIVQRDKDLLKADNESIFNAVCAIASLGLFIEPSFGHAYIGHYKEKIGLVWHTRAQFQMGWKGFVALGTKTGLYKKIHADKVVQGEYVGADRMTGDFEFDWKFGNDERNKLPIIGFVAYFELMGGMSKNTYMTITEMNNHAKEYSKTFKEKEGDWHKNYDKMGKKTVLKLLLDKFAPKSSEMQRAIRYDQAIIGNDGSLNYADNPATKTKLTLEESNQQQLKKRTFDFIKNSKTLEQLEGCFEAIDGEEMLEAYETKKKELKSKK